MRAVILLLALAGSTLMAQPGAGEPPSASSPDAAPGSPPADTLPPDSLPADTLQAATITPSTRPEEPEALLQTFFAALRAGEGETVVALASEELLESVGVMLDGLKESLEDDPDAVLSRLRSAGYSAGLEEMEDWTPEEYLAATVEVPYMTARYAVYEMSVESVEEGGRSAVASLVFTTAGGAEIPFEATLNRSDGLWWVSGFMGLSSFP